MPVVPAQRASRRERPTRSVTVHGGPAEIMAVVSVYARAGWQLRSAVAVTTELWQLTLLGPVLADDG